MKRGDVVLYHYTPNQRNEKMLAVVITPNIDTVGHGRGKVYHIHSIRFMWADSNFKETDTLPFDQQLADNFLTVIGNLTDLGIDIDGLPDVL